MPTRQFLIQRLLPRILRVVEGAENLLSRWSIPISDSFASPDHSVHLFISHGRGGGSEHYTRQQIAVCAQRGEHTHLLTFSLFARCFILDGQRYFSARALIKALQALQIGHIHLHHVRYFPYGFVQTLPALAEKLGATYDVTLHDFMSFCPRIHLMSRNWLYCGMPTDSTICQRCITQNGMLTSAPYSISQWRNSWEYILSKASGIFAPSDDTRHRHLQFFPRLNIQPWHEKGAEGLAANAPSAPPPADRSQPLRIALVGNIYQLKGADIVLACARDAKERGLPLHFSIIGNCTQKDALEALGVPVSGPYVHSDLANLLKASGAHAIFLASTWPETYSYVLSEIWQHGYFPIAFDLGAPAERIRASGKGALIDARLMENPSALNDKLFELVA